MSSNPELIITQPLIFQQHATSRPVSSNATAAAAVGRTVHRQLHQLDSQQLDLMSSACQGSPQTHHSLDGTCTPASGSGGTNSRALKAFANGKMLYSLGTM